MYSQFYLKLPKNSYQFNSQDKTVVKIFLKDSLTILEVQHAT